MSTHPEFPGLVPLSEQMKDLKSSESEGSAAPHGSGV